MVTYNLTVEARDDGNPSLRDTTTVIIDIIDVNDNQPEFVVDFDSQGLPISEVIH